MARHGKRTAHRAKRPAGVVAVEQAPTQAAAAPKPGTEWVVFDADEGQRLDKYLASPERLGSRGSASAALDRGQVWLNGKECQGADGAVKLAASDRVRVWRDRPGSARRHTRPRTLSGFRVVFEDDTLIVVDKPAGLLTVPLPDRDAQPSVLDGLDAEYAARTRQAPLVVHRIDRDTSGLVVFAKTRAALGALRRQFKQREPERVYLALVRGVPEPRRGTWHDWVMWDAKGLALRPAALQRDAVEAILNYEVREAFRDAALVQVTLVTGRQNQIRAQAMFHGYPLLGEQKYGIDGADAGVGDGASVVDRQALHAHRLGFTHPVTGQPVHFESPLPKDLNRLLARLRDARR